MLGPNEEAISVRHLVWQRHLLPLDERRTHLADPKDGNGTSVPRSRILGQGVLTGPKGPGQGARHGIMTPHKLHAEEPRQGVEAGSRGDSGLPTSFRGPIWAGQNHTVTIGVAKPDLPMVRTTIAIRGIAMPRQNDLGPELGDSGKRLIKIVNLEPQQDSIAMGQCRVSDGAVVVGAVPPV